jgi:hypothetical protein
MLRYRLCCHGPRSTSFEMCCFSGPPHKTKGASSDGAPLESTRAAEDGWLRACARTRTVPPSLRCCVGGVVKVSDLLSCPRDRAVRRGPVDVAEVPDLLPNSRRVVAVRPGRRRVVKVADSLSCCVVVRPFGANRIRVAKVPDLLCRGVVERVRLSVSVCGICGSCLRLQGLTSLTLLTLFRF